MKKILIASCLILASCAQIQTGAAKIQSWSNSPNGRIVLASVKAAAQAFEPQYAGVIGKAINSVQTGSIPSAKVIASAIGAATGNSASSEKVSVIAAAVITAAKSAPSPDIGMNSASEAVNSITK